MEKKLKTEEMLIEAKNFFNFYKKELGKYIRGGKKVVFISFQDLSSFSHELAENILSYPEEMLQILDVALEDLGLVSNPRVRLLDLPETHFIKVRNLRAIHLNTFITIEGIVRQASEVRPQVVNAKFECPSCGTIISVLPGCKCKI
ncbi:minichromosome maintenance protein MCM [Candidatus Pacearchaeota archaeon]|nr:minichromosome maintenance protein MCM [Candidatus Pacearchaeota archaeon]